MESSKPNQLSPSSASTILYKSLSADDLRELLPPFYLGLDFDARRARFGCAVSDDSIIRHCRGLEFGQVVVLGCIAPIGLIVAIELYPLLPAWEVAEVAIAERATRGRMNIIGHLLQIAAFDLEKRGCTTLVVPLSPSEHDLRRMLHGVGRVWIRGDNAHVDFEEPRFPSQQPRLDDSAMVQPKCGVGWR